MSSKLFVDPEMPEELKEIIFYDPIYKGPEQAKIIYGDRNQKTAAREGQMGESGLAEKGRE